MFSNTVQDDQCIINMWICSNAHLKSVIFSKNEFTLHPVLVLTVSCTAAIGGRHATLLPLSGRVALRDDHQ